MIDRVKKNLSNEYQEYHLGNIDFAEYLYHLNQVGRVIRRAWITDLITNDEYNESMLEVARYRDKV